MKKFLKVLQYAVSIFLLLVGVLCMIGGAGMPCVLLLLLSGAVIFPPVTRRIPHFKFRKAVLIAASLVLALSATLAEANTEPATSGSTAAKIQTETAAAPEEAAPEAASASAKAEQETGEDAAKAAELKTLIEADYKLSELPKKDAKKFAKESEDVFYQAWHEVLAEKVNDPREYSSDPDADLLNDLSKLVAFYDKVYAGSAKIDSYRTLNAEAATQKSKAATAKSQAHGLLEGDYADTVESQNFYITQRLENSYGGGVLDEIGRALESEDNTQWVAYNVETIMGQAYPGDHVYVLVTDSKHSFSETGAYRLSYMPMGKTMDLTDSKGFIKTASVYYIVDKEEFEAIRDQYQDANHQLYLICDELRTEFAG